MDNKLFAALNQPDAPNKDDRGHTHVQPIDGPVPGEALTGKPGALPIEKPAQYAEVDDALDFLFSKLMQRRVAAEFLAYMEAGVPVDMLAHTLIMSGLGEGKWPVTAVHLMAGPVTIMLIRMAESAKIKWTQTGDQGVKDKIPEIINSLAAEKVKTGPADASALALEQLQRGGMSGEAKGFMMKRS